MTDIRYAILGLLSWRSLTGYDLKRIISDSELLYWSGNNNQIYNHLVELHREGLVTQEIHQQENLPAKKIYSITPQGRETLRKWSMAVPELPEIHHPFLIQLAWSGSLTADELDKLFMQYEEDLQARILMQRRVQSQHQDLPPDHNSLEKWLWEQTGDHLRENDENELKWIRQLRAQITAGNLDE
mgnify:FL=1